MKKQPVILIFEKDRNSQKLLSDVLSHHGYLTEVTTSVEETVGFLRNRRPDLMLLDLTLSGDGFAVLDALRAQEDASGCDEHVPVVAMTAWAMSNDRDRVKQARVDACHAKPIDVRGILHTVRQLMPIEDERSP